MTAAPPPPPLLLALLFLTLALAQPATTTTTSIASASETTTGSPNAAPVRPCSGRFALEPCPPSSSSVSTAACKAVDRACPSATNCEPDFVCVDGLAPLTASCTQVSAACLLTSSGIAARGICTEALKCASASVGSSSSSVTPALTVVRSSPEGACQNINGDCVATGGKKGVCRLPAQQQQGRKRDRIALECVPVADSAASSMLLSLAAIGAAVAAMQ